MLPGESPGVTAHVPSESCVLKEALEFHIPCLNHPWDVVRWKGEPHKLGQTRSLRNASFSIPCSRLNMERDAGGICNTQPHTWILAGSFNKTKSVT